MKTPLDLLPTAARLLAEHVARSAKTLFEEDGYLAPCTFLTDGPPDTPTTKMEIIGTMDFHEADKLGYMRVCRERARDLGAVAAVFVAEAWSIDWKPGDSPPPRGRFETDQRRVEIAIFVVNTRAARVIGKARLLREPNRMGDLEWVDASNQTSAGRMTDIIPLEAGTN